MDDKPLRTVVWVGSSRDDIAETPKAVRGSFGVRLQELQRGKNPSDTKPLSQFGSGVFEMRASYERNAYRMMYVLKLKRAIYVLHVFMKKPASGIGLPRPDAALIMKRLKDARRMDEEN
jgi:phage-related protein